MYCNYVLYTPNSMNTTAVPDKEASAIAEPSDAVNCTLQGCPLKNLAGILNGTCSWSIQNTCTVELEDPFHERFATLKHTPPVRVSYEFINGMPKDTSMFAVFDHPVNPITACCATTHTSPSPQFPGISTTHVKSHFVLLDTAVESRRISFPHSKALPPHNACSILL